VDRIRYSFENWVKKKVIRVNLRVEGKNHSFQRRQHTKDGCNVLAGYYVLKINKK